MGGREGYFTCVRRASRSPPSPPSSAGAFDNGSDDGGYTSSPGSLVEGVGPVVPGNPETLRDPGFEPAAFAEGLLLLLLLLLLLFSIGSPPSMIFSAFFSFLDLQNNFMNSKTTQEVGNSFHTVFNTVKARTKRRSRKRGNTAGLARRSVINCRLVSVKCIAATLRPWSQLA